MNEFHVRAGQELLRGNQQIPAEGTLLPIMVRRMFDAAEMNSQQQAARQRHERRQRRQNGDGSPWACELSAIDRHQSSFKCLLACR
jgi:hypothetical protein